MGRMNGGGFQKKVPRYRLSGLWAVISSFGDVSKVRGEILVEGFGFIVGKGERVRFWFDDWVGVGPLQFLYPRVFRVVSNKECSVKELKECYVWVGNTMSWDSSSRRALHQIELGENESLCLLANIVLCRDSSDPRIWKPDST